MNTDGKIDVVVVNYTSSNVSILLGNGDGSFQAAVNYATGSGPVAVALGDFNADGKADLALPNQGSHTLSILLGNGDGTFQAAVNYAAAGLPYSVTAGDVNGDGTRRPAALRRARGLQQRRQDRSRCSQRRQQQREHPVKQQYATGPHRAAAGHVG
ncbi:MAG: VCBS repeat-containing protein [Planctomycetia bacterium]|nr:VCBS repeat-containing protein [Planctomycetia bacterium]